MSVGFVPSSSANLKLLEGTWTDTDKAKSCLIFLHLLSTCINQRRQNIVPFILYFLTGQGSMICHEIDHYSIARSCESWGKPSWCVDEIPVYFWFFDTLIDLICVVVSSERETETLNRARQLVFSSDNLAAPVAHLGYVTIYIHHLYPPLLSYPCLIFLSSIILFSWGSSYSILTSFFRPFKRKKVTRQSLKAIYDMTPDTVLN